MTVNILLCQICTLSERMMIFLPSHGIMHGAIYFKHQTSEHPPSHRLQCTKQQSLLLRGITFKHLRPFFKNMCINVPSSPDTKRYQKFPYALWWRFSFSVLCRISWPASTSLPTLFCSYIPSRCPPDSSRRWVRPLHLTSTARKPPKIYVLHLLHKAILLLCGWCLLLSSFWLQCVLAAIQREVWKVGLHTFQNWLGLCLRLGKYWRQKVQLIFLIWLQLLITCPSCLYLQSNLYNIVYCWTQDYLVLCL